MWGIMPKLVFIMPSPAARTGGNKTTCRHVQALVEMGYDAVVRILPGQALPAWFPHDTPSDVWTSSPAPDEVLVISEDATPILARCAPLPNRKVVHCKNPYNAAAAGLWQLSAEERSAYRTFIACSDGVAGWIARFFDHDLVATVPTFVDPELFKPGEKARVIACMPRKRRFERAAIQGMFQRLIGERSDWSWDVIDGRTEAQTAAALSRAAVFLSLARFEGMCTSILEGMASGCLVAGFTGLGAREYTTSLNGLWVEEDDCEAAARALARAVELHEAAGVEAAMMRDAARRTAASWNEAAFRDALARFWAEGMGLAPGRSG